MISLKLYITLLKYNYNCVADANQALGKLHNSNRVFFFDKYTGTIYMDGDWWSDFNTSHTLDVCEMILISLRTRFKTTHLNLIYRNEPNACFTWNEKEKAYTLGL